MRQCTFCDASATLSVCVILSTVGVKPRLQANTQSLPVCGTCLSGLEAWNGVAGSPGFKERVNTAAVTLTERSNAECRSISEAKEQPSTKNEAHESVPALLSLPIRD